LFGHSDTAAVSGLVHAARMLADATLRNQTLQRCRQVMGAKVAGAWNVHSATLIAEESLEYLVMFSSTAALLGSPGQANYAAANASLDATAHLRSGMGSAAASMQWGAWAGAGMATQHDTLTRTAAAGLGEVSVNVGMEALGGVCCGQALGSQIAVVPIRWPQLLLWVAPPFLAHFRLHGPFADAKVPKVVTEEAAGTCVQGVLAASVPEWTSNESDASPMIAEVAL
jgi:hypothetical protein